MIYTMHDRPCEDRAHQVARLSVPRCHRQHRQLCKCRSVLAKYGICSHQRGLVVCRQVYMLRTCLFLYALNMLGD